MDGRLTSMVFLMEEQTQQDEMLDKELIAISKAILSESDNLNTQMLEQPKGLIKQASVRKLTRQATIN